MKELLEEYGGVIASCIMGLMLLGIITKLLGSEGGLSQLFLIFLEGLGAKRRFL